MDFKTIRTEAGLSQRALAELIGIAQPHICYIERAQAGGFDERLAKVLGDARQEAAATA